ncbi:sugar transferase [Paracoccus yeei]|jgi:lipopolysaccharide/colanic/teichoic acid biosynthesis glycosyltransferase
MFYDRVKISANPRKSLSPTADLHLTGGTTSFRRQGFYASRGKRVLDVTGAIVLLIVFLPLILAVALTVGSQGKGMFFGHARVGQNGRAFRCLKFRTMVPDAEQRLRDLLERDAVARLQWQTSHKLDNDPRITRLGHFLRRTSLDELPQLWNVIRGDMSLVGPRPVTAAELVERYRDSAVAYMAVRPGLTGPWQVSGRNSISYEERVRIDRGYAISHSLGLDMTILARTVLVVLGANGK